MPYHPFGISKGGNIGQLQQEFPVPGEEEKKNWLSWFEQNGKEEGKTGGFGTLETGSVQKTV